MSSGSLSTAAAPMIGVASRNEKRAASSLERPEQQSSAHRRPRAGQPRDERERLRGTDRQRPAQAQAPDDPDVALRPCALDDRSVAPQALGAVEHHAVERQEHRCGLR
jgi:hypothetical protein